MQHIIETERLTLRKFDINDAPFIIALVNSKGWLEFIGDRNIKTEQEAIYYLENGPIKSYAQHGFGLCLVQLKNTNIPVGMCGILKRDALEFPDIGFAFLPEFTGKGYAFEIASATLTYANESLNLAIITAITVAHHAACIKLLEKLGMKYIRAFSFSEAEEALLLYSI